MATKSSVPSEILKKAKKELRGEIEALMAAMSPEDRNTQSSDVYNQVHSFNLVRWRNCLTMDDIRVFLVDQPWTFPEG